jgi:hypothetical protein
VAGDMEFPATLPQFANRDTSPQLCMAPFHFKMEQFYFKMEQFYFRMEQFYFGMEQFYFRMEQFRFGMVSFRSAYSFFSICTWASSRLPAALYRLLPNIRK